MNTNTINLISSGNPNRKSIFFSKFSKFNLHCLLDLIEEKDSAEFRNLIKHLEAQQGDIELPSFNSIINTANSPLRINDVKVYLRFNWYSFNELNLSYSSSLITTNMGASSSTSKILTPNPAPSQLISKMFQQPNVTQMYANKNIYSSVNGSQIQNLGIDSILHNQVNPHQPNVFTAPNSSNLSNQHQYQHQQQRYQIYSSGAISSHSSSSTVYNQSSGKPNKYAKTYGPRSKTLGGT